MRERESRKLQGPYALFFLGVVHDDEPHLVGHSQTLLWQAGDALWGSRFKFPWHYVGLWSTPTDRAHTLSEVKRLRAEKLQERPHDKAADRAEM